jgi:type II secretion system protein G
MLTPINSKLPSLFLAHKKEHIMNRRGFTLIELLIVIVVIAILALIVIPKLMGAARQAKESTLKANLQRIRSSVAQFQADTGVYPAAIADVVAGTAPTAGAGGASIPAGSYKGPYLTAKGGIGGNGLPMNPFVAATDGTVSDHWTYATADGSVSSTVTGTTVDGVSYTAL